MIRKLVFLLPILVLLAGSAWANSPNEGIEFLAKVGAAVAAGELTAEEALLYQFYYMFEQEKLPAVYRPTEFSPLKCGTPLVAAFLRMRNQLSPSTVATIEGYLHPENSSREDRAIYISPNGIFRLTYDTSGPNAVPAADVNPPNGVPDFVEHCASYMDYSWHFEIEIHGFTPPPLNPYYEVGFESMDNYGYTLPTGGDFSRIVLHNNFLSFPPNDDPEGDQWGAAKVTCAHEFKHSSQLPTSHWTEGKFEEVDATWMEEMAYDVVNDYYNYMGGGTPNPISAPDEPLDDVGIGGYEDAIWEIWMSETWGIDFVWEFWNRRSQYQGQESALATYVATLIDHGGVTLAEGWNYFTGWNYATGSRAIGGLGYDEAADYPPSSLQWNIYSFPASVSGSVEHLAANFIRTINFAGHSGALTIEFDGERDGMTLTAVVDRLDGTGYLLPIPLDAHNNAWLQIPDPITELEQVGLVVGYPSLVSGNSAYSLNIDITPYIPVPALNVDVTSVEKTLPANSTGTETIALTNIGEEGSVLDYTIGIVGSPPARGVGSRGAHEFEEVVARLAEPSFEAPGRTIPQSSRYPGDCVLGNDNIGGIFGQYSSFWQGNEMYAFFVDPQSYSCSCDPGFQVRAMHVELYLTAASGPQMRAHLYSADGGPTCYYPGGLLDTSDPITVSVGSSGYRDIEIPCDFACRAMGGKYFLVIEFMDANGPVGIPFDNNARPCYNYIDRGSGWQELHQDYNFFGDIFIWADVDCCAELDPQVHVDVPDGGEYWSVGTSYEIQWTAVALDDVKIELSRDGGSTWETIVASTPNDGVHPWTVTLPQSEDCLVRVSSTGGEVGDTSNAPFTIHQPPIWLQVVPPSGDLDHGETDMVDLNFDTAGLLPDTYEAYVVIEFDPWPGSPFVMPVTLTVLDNTSSVGEGTPVALSLHGNSPNPFNPLTRISFTLPQAGPARLDVFDVRGRLVSTLWQGELAAGPQAVSWDGRDERGRGVAAGTYFAHLRAGDQKATCKMILAK